MSHANAAQQLPMPSKLLLNLSARLTIGSAVCFTEGLAATILAMLPDNLIFHLGAVVLAFVVWLGFWLYRDSKLGADIGDLCFWEMIARIGQLILFTYGIKFWGFWYLYASLSFLKLIRVYLRHNTATQQYGWGKFGPMTLYYGKRQANVPTPWLALAKEIAIALTVAIFISWLIKFLPGWGRVLLMWSIPVVFEFWIGPIQLRMVRDFSTEMLSSNHREDEKDTEIQRIKIENEALKRENDDLKRENNTLRQMQSAPKKHHTDLIEAYESTKPERQWHLVKIAQGVARQFAKQPKT